MKSGKLLIALLACWLLASCVATNQDLNPIYSRLGATEKQIKDINNQLNISGDGTVLGQAEMWSQVQALRQDMNLATGQISELQAQNAGGESSAQLKARLDRLEAAVRKMASVLAIDVNELDAAMPPPQVQAPNQYQAEQPQGTVYSGSDLPIEPSSPGAVGGAVGEAAGGATVAAGTRAVSTPPATSAPDSTLPNTLYNSGTKAFSERRYQDAVKIFQDFVKTYPENKLTSNAYFWQGESHYQQKNYSNAITAYQQVIEKFPGSDKLQAAMFKQGVTMYQQGQKEAGRVRLNELIAKYPKSQEAERARQFLKSNR